MGERSATNTLAQVFMALIEERTINQAKLAKQLEIEVRTVRRHLLDMLAAGVPLEREEDHPNVFWSVPKDWFPGGIAVTSAEVMDVIRYLMRSPKSRERERLIERFLHRAGGRASSISSDLVVAPSLDDQQDAHVRLFEDALADRVAVTMVFFSTKRGMKETRTVSIHRLLFSDPAKFVAVCHRSDTLKWFRLDHVERVHRDPNVAYRERSDDEIDRLVEDTRFGFHQAGDPTAHRFVVSDPDHRWVAVQLGRSVDAVPVDGGVRFEITTAAITPLARFVVSLGRSARVETPELAAAVRELALGALANAEADSPAPEST